MLEVEALKMRSVSKEAGLSVLLLKCARDKHPQNTVVRTVSYSPSALSQEVRNDLKQDTDRLIVKMVKL